MSQVTMTVNGKTHSADLSDRMTLVDFLRDGLGLTGTHTGCEQGVCGACTVLIDGTSVLSCLMFAVQANGADIATIEGLAEGTTMHALQEAFWEKQGLQCGFCTPGMLMRAVEMLRDDPDPSYESVREGIAGNLCRCTGYQFIVEAVVEAAQHMRESAQTGGGS